MHVIRALVSSLLIITLFAFPSAPAGAFQLGSFHDTCTAPNWITNQPELVEEVNVPNVGYQPLMAFTRKMPHGHWRIEYNVDRIRHFNLSDNVIVFLFYHECAHAMHNSADEIVADCGGLALMDARVGVTEAALHEVSTLYASVGRPFPPNC